MIVTISGLAGAGKTTVANDLSERLGVPAIDVGQVFREEAERHNMDIVAFSDYRKSHPEIDRQIDDAVIQKCQETEGCILQGRLTAWLTKQRGIKACRVWLAAKPEIRAGRITHREGGDPAARLADLERRDGNDRQIYKETYGIDLNDLSVYDIVVPTDDLSADEVVSFILNELQKYG